MSLVTSDEHLAKAPARVHHPDHPGPDRTEPIVNATRQRPRGRRGDAEVHGGSAAGRWDETGLGWRLRRGTRVPARSALLDAEELPEPGAAAATGWVCSSGRVGRARRHRSPAGRRAGRAPGRGGVTVNTVTVDDGQIVETLRFFWPDVELLCDPSPLTGGCWATMWRLRLTGTPAGIPGEVVLRVMSDAPSPSTSSGLTSEPRSPAPGAKTSTTRWNASLPANPARGAPSSATATSIPSTCSPTALAPPCSTGPRRRGPAGLRRRLHLAIAAVPAARRPACPTSRHRRCGLSALALRFVRLYRRANPAADLRGLDWYVGLHALRILSNHEIWTRNGDRRARDHPLSSVALAPPRLCAEPSADRPPRRLGAWTGSTEQANRPAATGWAKMYLHERPRRTGDRARP